MKKLRTPARTAKPSTDRARAVEAPRPLATDRLAEIAGGAGGLALASDDWNM